MDENKELAANTRQRMKKSIALLIAVAMMLALTACGSIKELASIKNMGKTEVAQYDGDSIDGNIQSDYATAAVDEIIEFGAYEQDNNTSNGKEPIEWQVLERDGDKVLVISKYALDTKQYNTEYEDVTWETCTLRTWLNETFLNEAFSEAEQRIIQTTEVSADRYPGWSTDPGNATKDKIFLLSINEAKKYFASDEARMCAPTASARAYTDDNYKVDGAATCYWWLRSPGSLQNLVATVSIDGYIIMRSFVANSDGSVDYYTGIFVNDDYVCVRPAMWIDFDA